MEKNQENVFLGAINYRPIKPTNYLKVTLHHLLSSIAFSAHFCCVCWLDPSFCRLKEPILHAECAYKS
jgi:hypothetical protein